MFAALIPTETVNRRTFLLGSGAAITVGVAGCTESDEDSPEAVTEQFLEAFYDGEFEEAETYIHPDDDEFSAEGAAEDVGDMIEESEITVEAVELVEEATGEPIVAATATRVPESEDEEAETDTEELLLRTHNGEWLIVGDPAESTLRQSAPQAALSLRCDGDRVVVRHEGGDELDGGALSSEGDGSFSASKLSAGAQTTLVDSPSGETEHRLVNAPPGSSPGAVALTACTFPQRLSPP